MEHLMTAEESYVERRQLFKDIWATAMQIDEKEGEILSKPKVIKTLHLDEVDRCTAGKKKKQRIKNLRTVCNKILEFCDRQDAADMFYEQMTTEGNVPAQHKIELKLKKLKPTRRIRKKVKKTKSLLSPSKDITQARTTTSERKEELNTDYGKKTSRNTSPIKVRYVTAAVKKSNLSTINAVSNFIIGSQITPVVCSPRDTTVRRKVVKKKIAKIKPM
ncbi:uncharacterized protein ACR2FA_007759 [Aphomia sociella]